MTVQALLRVHVDMLVLVMVNDAEVVGTMLLVDEERIVMVVMVVDVTETVPVAVDVAPTTVSVRAVTPRTEHALEIWSAGSTVQAARIPQTSCCG